MEASTADANTAEIRLIDVKDRGASTPSAQELADHSAERGFSAHAWDIQACMNLERYEARIERRLRKLLAQLEARQARRRNPEKRSNKAKPETSE